MGRARPCVADCSEGHPAYRPNSFRQLVDFPLPSWYHKSQRFGYRGDRQAFDFQPVGYTKPATLRDRPVVPRTLGRERSRMSTGHGNEGGKIGREGDVTGVTSTPARVGGGYSYGSGTAYGDTSFNNKILFWA